MVGHVEELELVGSGGEGGAHDEVHLHLQDYYFQSTLVILYLLCSSLTVGNIVPSELSWERSCLKEAFYPRCQFHFPKAELQTHLSVVLYWESKLVRSES